MPGTARHLLRLLLSTLLLGGVLVAAAPPAQAITATGCQTATDATNDESNAALDLTSGAYVHTIGSPGSLRVEAFFTVRSLPTNPADTVPAGQLGVSWEVRLADLYTRTGPTPSLSVPYLRVHVSAGSNTPSYEIGYYQNGGFTMTATTTGTYQAGTPGVLAIDAASDSLTVKEGDVLTDAVTTSTVIQTLSYAAHDSAPDSGVSSEQAMVATSSTSCLDQSNATQSTALSADGFVDSIGVNTHLNFTPSNYRSLLPNGTDKWPSVESALNSLGVRYIRDQLPQSGQTDYLGELQRLYSVYGIMNDIITTPANIESNVNNLKPMLDTLAGQLVSIEPPNEADAGSTSGMAQRQQDLSTMLSGDTSLNPIPFLGPSFGNRADYRGTGDLSSYADAGNLHAYPLGEPYTKTASLDSFKYLNSFVTGTEPVQVTETGYEQTGNTFGPVSEQAAGSYIPKTYLTNFANGVQRTYAYELLDESPYQPSDQDTWGLMHNDFTAKPAYTTLKNLITLLKDPGSSFTLGSLTQSYSDSSIRHLLMQKRDGSYWLALWQDAKLYTPAAGNLSVASKNVTVTLGSAKATTVYHPADSTSSVSTGSSSTSFTVSVAATGLVLVKLT